jgi:hypothetical protein
MDPMKGEVLRTKLPGLALLRVRITPVLVPKGTVRTDITGTTALRMTGTGIGPGMNLPPVS